VSNDADPNLSRLYRAGAQEEPPPWLDASIVAAADEAGARSRRVPRRLIASRWGLPLALAAVLTLSVSLVIVMRDEPGVLGPDAVPSAQTDALSTAVPPRASVPAAPAADAARRAESAAPAQVPQAMAEVNVGQLEKKNVQPAPDRQAKQPLSDVDLGRARLEAERSAAVPEAVSKSVAPMPAPAVVQAPAATVAEERSAVVAVQPKAESAQASGAMAAREQNKRLAVGAVARDQAPTAASAEKPRAADGRPDDSSDPEQWLRWIARLRREGREAEARASLEEFRKRFPTHPVPEALK
jgi:resuscitation-promoting factor RpfA